MVQTVTTHNKIAHGKLTIPNLAEKSTDKYVRLRGLMYIHTCRSYVHKGASLA